MLINLSKFIKIYQNVDRHAYMRYRRVGVSGRRCAKLDTLNLVVVLDRGGERGGARAQAPGEQKCHRHHRPIGQRCLAIGAPIGAIGAWGSGRRSPNWIL